MKENQAREILGDALFDRCCSFFEDVFSRNSEYKIILTRRCFSLFKIFAPILEGKGITNESGYIITDNAVNSNLQGIRQALENPQSDGAASVLIVDDIIIYGRTINTILDKIFGGEVNNDAKENIRVLCFVKNMRNCINEAYARLILSYNVVSSIEWKMYSYLFSKLIKASEIANTSYIVSAKLPLENYGKSFVEYCEKRMCCTTTEELSENLVDSYVIAAEPSDQIKNLFKLPTDVCSFVRVYVYKKHKTIMLSPLLILNDLSDDQMSSILYAIVEVLCGCSDNLKAMLLDDNSFLCSHRMRMLTLLLSHVMLRDFMKSNDLQFSLEDSDYKEIIQYNFFNLESEEFKKVDSIVSELEGGLFSYSSDGIDSNFEELENFVFDKAMADNNAVSENPNKRQEGFNKMGHNLLFTRSYIAGLMVLIDNGLAALRAVYQPEDNFFVSYIYPGEQAFRAMSDSCKELLPSMYTLENISEMYNKNSYDLFREFSKRILMANLQTQEKHDTFLYYVGILEKNNQRISDVMCVDYTEDLRDKTVKISELLNHFEEEVLTK